MIFNTSVDAWKEKSGYWTAKEIDQQPATWEKTIAQIKREKEAIATFIAQVTSQEDYDIILTGAGTSEFVGNACYSYVNKLTNYKCKSYPTTDLVVTPENFVSKTKPTLLVSYGRSGNSPESVGAIDAVNAVCENIYHLFITCNPEGALSKYAVGKSNCYSIDITPETHDVSFAMTSSFSNMYLATVLSFSLDNLDEAVSYAEAVVAGGKRFIGSKFETIANMVNEYDFQRIVYLGSNCLKGVAQESALKMLELNAGIVVTMFDTPLGFRHGPKSIIDDTTLTVVLLSDEPYARRYEIDLIKEMSGQRKGNKILAVSSYEDAEVKGLVDYFFSFDNDTKLDNVFLGLNFIMVGQFIGLSKSVKNNITPDNPCPTGEVNRVVQGVTIYDYNEK